MCKKLLWTLTHPDHSNNLPPHTHTHKFKVPPLEETQLSGLGPSLLYLMWDRSLDKTVTKYNPALASTNYITQLACKSYITLPARGHLNKTTLGGQVKPLIAENNITNLQLQIFIFFHVIGIYISYWIILYTLFMFILWYLCLLFIFYLLKFYIYW